MVRSGRLGSGWLDSGSEIGFGFWDWVRVLGLFPSARFAREARITRFGFGFERRYRCEQEQGKND